MKLRILFITLVAIVLGPLSVIWGHKSERSVQASPISYDMPTAECILDATVHIILYPKRSPGNDSDSQPSRGKKDPNKVANTVDIVRARGIGSVVTIRGHVLIITHDHWNWLSDELDRVEYRNAQNELILQMSGDAFLQTIRYRDGGTMILEAPGILLSSGIVPATLNLSEAITSGKTVYLAYRPTTDRSQADVKAAVLESFDTREGLPVFLMRSLDGQPVIQGDSGGGVWMNGQLVGNLWRGVTVETIVQETRIWGTREYTETSADTWIAAAFPLNEQELETILTMRAEDDIIAEY